MFCPSTVLIKLLMSEEPVLQDIWDLLFIDEQFHV